MVGVAASGLLLLRKGEAGGFSMVSIELIIKQLRIFVYPLIHKTTKDQIFRAKHSRQTPDGEPKRQHLKVPVT